MATTRIMEATTKRTLQRALEPRSPEPRRKASPARLPFRALLYYMKTHRQTARDAKYNYTGTREKVTPPHLSAPPRTMVAVSRPHI